MKSNAALPTLASRWDEIVDGTGDSRWRIHSRVGRENGAGKPALVLVPGLVVTSRNVAPTAERLQDAFSVYCLDLPGFGKSSRPSRVLSVPELASALLAWMEAAGLADAHLLGNSFGCQVIAELACRHPGRVRRLVLTGPALDPRLRGMWRPAVRLLLDAFFEPALVGPVFYDFWEMGPRRVWGTYRAALADRIEDNLPRLTMPALLIRGARDPIARADWLVRMTDLLPDARARTLAGAPHAVVSSAPDAVARLTRSFCLGETLREMSQESA